MTRANDSDLQNQIMKQPQDVVPWMHKVLDTLPDEKHRSVAKQLVEGLMAMTIAAWEQRDEEIEKRVQLEEALRTLDFDHPEINNMYEMIEDMTTENWDENFHAWMVDNLGVDEGEAAEFMAAVYGDGEALFSDKLLRMVETLHENLKALRSVEVDSE